MSTLLARSAFAIVALAAPLMSAASVVTAEYFPISDSGGSSIGYANQLAVGQSFTATISGSLESIALKLVTHTPIDPLSIDLYTASGDFPGVLLGTISSGSIVTGTNTFDFTSQNIPILAGSKYVVTASTATNAANPQFEMRGVGFNPYPGGIGIVRSGSSWGAAPFALDYLFSAQVVPEPATLLPLAAAAAALRRARRRHPTA